MKQDESLIEEWITTRNWEDLDDKEKSIVLGSMGSAGEYTRLRLVHLKLWDTSRNYVATPDDTILTSLQTRLEPAKTPFLKIVKLKIPAYYALLFLAVGAAAGWMLSRTPGKSVSPPALVRTIMKTDTVYRTNTVVRERLVYRPVKYEPRAVSTLPPVAKKAIDSVGVSMKERDALQQLLVSMP